VSAERCEQVKRNVESRLVLDSGGACVLRRFPGPSLIDSSVQQGQVNALTLSAHRAIADNEFPCHG